MVSPLIKSCAAVLINACLLGGALCAQSNAATTVAELKQKAQAGDAQAQAALGLAYRDGDGVAPDPSKAAEWFRKAADQGSPVAQNALGILYHTGSGVEKDFAQSFGWYKKAAAQKYGPGVFNVAISYYNAEGAPEDAVTAYAWMLLADELGDRAGHDAATRTAEELAARTTEGELKLAEILDAGVELPKDEAAAAKWYGLAADHGSAEAQVKYGLMLVDGRGGLPKDPKQAFQFMRRAADQKYGPAMFTVGYAYQKGTLGQQIDIKKAITWYEGAATAGHPGAMVNLGLMNADGTVGPPNYKEAYFWLYMADAFNIPQAKSSIPTVKAHLSEKEIAGVEHSAAIWWQQKGQALLVRRRPDPPVLPAASSADDKDGKNDTAKIYPIGGDVHAPRAVYDPEPQFGPDNRTSGTVVLRFVVAPDGSTQNIEVVKSLVKDVDNEAIAAVRRWKFSPATRNGDPVAVIVTTEFNIHVSRR